MEVKAQLNKFRLAPRKVRAIVGLVKGKKVDDALNQLEYMVRRPVEPIKKLVNSAIANAENNFNMVRENLYIKTFYVDEGAKLLRHRAKGFGRAEPIQKKTSHITLILDEKVAGLKGDKAQRKKSEPEEVKSVEAKPEDSSIKTTKKPEIKKESGKKSSGVLGGLRKKIFQRKSI